MCLFSWKIIISSQIVEVGALWRIVYRCVQISSYTGRCLDLLVPTNGKEIVILEHGKKLYSIVRFQYLWQKFVKEHKFESHVFTHFKLAAVLS